MIDAPIRRQVSFSSGHVSLQGELLTPAGPGPHPAAVLVTAASGPRDRRSWVGALARSGLAVLTWDSPGFGASPGRPRWQAPDARALEVGAAADLLRTMPELVRPGIGLIGVDSGCWAAVLAASLATRVAAVTLLAAPCAGAIQQELIRLPQRVRGHGFGAPEAALADVVLRHRVRRLRQGQDSVAVWAAEAACRREPWYTLLPGTQPAELHAFGTLDLYRPAELLAGVRAPVLGLVGADDPATPMENAALLRSALAAAPHPEHRVRVLPRTDAVFAALARGLRVGRPPGDWGPEVVLSVADWMIPRILQWRPAGRTASGPSDGWFLPGVGERGLIAG